MLIQNQGSSFFFDDVIPALRGITEGALVPLQFRKQRTRRFEDPLKGAVSAQKALQGSEREASKLLGGK